MNRRQRGEEGKVHGDHPAHFPASRFPTTQIPNLLDAVAGGLTLLTACSEAATIQDTSAVTPVDVTISWAFTT
jgi:hypothetical protein